MDKADSFAPLPHDDDYIALQPRDLSAGLGGGG